MSDTDLYSRLLFAARHGYPLPHPQPFDDLPRRAGVEIGDVGVVTSDGSFDVFFNICRPDDPVNRFGLPQGFEVVPLEPSSYASRPTHFGPGSHISNSQTRARRVDLDVDVQSNPLIPVGAGTSDF
ncbi:hypothetical protein B0H12DRAFT_1158718 [Mycena haematopus]|nr:hypothetical protein B0H12DRAFT_1158718 [Mycena haematopus]